MSARPGLWRGARTRMLTAFVVLLAASTLVSILTLRQLLITRGVEQADRLLTQESEELPRQVGDRRDPQTGRRCVTTSVGS